MGPKLLPQSWPNHARVAVLITFDDDTQAPLLRDGITEPTALSASDYGAQTGTPRLLEILDRHKIPATFFVTGVDSLIHPELVPSILKSGRNEIGIHGWIHEYPPGLDSEGEEERLLDKAIARISSLTGKKPTGYRAPSWAFSPYTMDLIRRKGFLYDSSLQASEVPYKIFSKGQDTGVIELPIDWTLTETVYLGAQGHMPSPDLLFELYKQEFDGAYKEGTTFILTLHPYLGGHRAPMQHLDDLITYMQSKPGVWFATCGSAGAVCEAVNCHQVGRTNLSYSVGPARLSKELTRLTRNFVTKHTNLDTSKHTINSRQIGLPTGDRT